MVKIDFGSGTSVHGTALGSDVTSYNWTTANFPNDGSYTIESTTNTPNTWWTTTDHTGGGYMMVVNASLSTTDYFYKNTVTGLCPETTYEFAAWVMNLLKTNDTSPPNITFTIESTAGAILGSYNTGDIGLSSSVVWKQYGLFFTTPVGVSTVVIRMRNNKAGAAPGNDIALDDITFRPCGPTVTSTILNQSNTNLEICQNDAKSYTLQGVVSAGYSNPAYQWQLSTNQGVSWEDIAGATTLDYTFVPSTISGIYQYRIAAAQSTNIGSASCRVVSNVVTFKINDSPVEPQFTVVQPSCEIPTATIAVSGTSGYTYSVDGVNYQSNPVFSGLAGGNYMVTAKSVGGCVSVAKIAQINSVAISNATPTVSVIQPVICSNPYGTITVTSADYEYSFDNGITWTTNPVKTGLDIGFYQVKTRNSSNCETTAVSVAIEVPPGYPPTPTVLVLQPDCTVLTGAITVLDSAVFYSFDNGTTWNTSNSKNNLLPGTYQVLIKNSLGCVSLVPNTVTLNPYINAEPLSLAADQLFCVQQNATVNDIAIVGTNIKWYDAAANGNLLTGTTILQNGTYYASQTVAVCESLRIPVIINIQNTPVPTGASIQDFCTTQKATVVSLVVAGANIIWYNNATNGAVLPSTTALVNGMTYYATQTVNGCESVDRLAVLVSIVSPSIPVNDVADYICDDLNDGSEGVDLTAYQTQMTSNTTVAFSYFTTLSGAENKTTTEQITAITNYKLSLGTTVIFVRIDSNDKCYQVVELNLTLVSVPVVGIADVVSLCQNATVTIDVGAEFDNYLWSTGETTAAITIASSGNYWVTVTKNHGTVHCISTKNFSVILSNVAAISNIEVQDWTDIENVIVVALTGTSIGNYEYSLDGITYQDSATFSGLISGDYTVYVRDKNGCGIVSQEVFVLNYPKFFTPNNDGYNDTWAVKFSESEPGINTEIFDRYGKLIKELNATSSWDGTFNGHELPSTDYWFVVTRASGKVYKGHFSMKR